MLLVQSKIFEFMDAGFIVDIAMLNISRAFDVMLHVLLMDMLAGIRVSPLLVC